MSALTNAVGRVREALGWATADRREEARGKLEQLDDDPAPSRQDGADVLDEAELDVRSDHGDLAPSAEPEDHEPQVPPEGG
jgi:hypothetical protein